MQTRRALLLAASLGLVVSCDTADMSDPGGEEQEGTGVESPSGSDSSEGESDSPVSKIHLSDGVKAALSRGEAQDLIITLNDSALSGQKSKIAGFASLRTALMRDLAGFRANMKREYSHLPYMVINARDESILEALEANENVTGVFENEKFKPASTEALAAINWTPVATGTGSGSTVKVAILDSNVGFNFGASVTSNSLTITGDIDTGEASPTHGEAMVATIKHVAPGVGIEAFDVYANNAITADNVIDGLNAVLVRHATTPFAAVNISFEGPQAQPGQNCDSSTSMHEAIEDLVAAGIQVVAAAGNGGTSNRLASPACDTQVISVGATYDADLASATTFFPSGVNCSDALATNRNRHDIACFSNYSAGLTLVAPGALIDLDWDPALPTAPDNSPNYGTSYSAAFVTGAIAVIADKYPDEDSTWVLPRLLLSTTNGVRQGLDPKYVLDVTKATADVCLAVLEDGDETVAIAKTGTTTPAPELNLEFNKAGCGLVAADITGNTTLTTSWLTATPAAIGPTDTIQAITLTAPHTSAQSARTPDATCLDGSGTEKKCLKLNVPGLNTAGTDKTNDITVRVTQALDNSAPVLVDANVSIVDDTVEPAGIFQIGDDSDNAKSGLQAAVTVVYTSASDDGTPVGSLQYCLSLSTASACTETAWATLTASPIEADFNLGSGEGLRTISFFVRDAAKNPSVAGVNSTTTVDTVAPANGSLAATVTPTPAGTPVDANVELTFTLPNENGSAFASAALYKATSPTLPTCTGTPLKSWLNTELDTEATATFTETIPTPNGSVTYNYIACVTDGAGNTSLGATASARPRTDTAAPAVAGVLVEGVSGAAATTFAALMTEGKCAAAVGNTPISCFTNGDVTLELSGLTGTPSHYCIGPNAQACTDTSTNWTALPALSACTSVTSAVTDCADITLAKASLVAGRRNYFVAVRDAQQNATAALPFQLLYDTSAPPNGRLTLDATLAASSVSISWAAALDTGSKNKTYTIVGTVTPAGTTTPVPGPVAKCTDGTPVAAGNTPISAPVVHNTGVTAGDTWNYRVCITDNAGNTSDGMTGSVKIRGEVAGPVPLAANTDPARVIIDGCAATPLQNQAACENADCHWNTTACVPNMIRIGATKWTRLALPRVWAQARDIDTPAGLMEVCYSTTTVLAKQCTNWTSYADQLDPAKGRTVSLAGGGKKYVSGWVRDSWGNLSDSNTAVAGAQPYRDAINFDRLPPVEGALTTTSAGGKITVKVSGIVDADGDPNPMVVFASGVDDVGTAGGNKAVEVFWRKGKTAPGASVCASRPAASRVCQEQVSAAGAVDCDHTGLTVGEFYSYRACAQDSLGNWNRGKAVENVEVK